MPSVLLAHLFGHRGFASGQTLCLRRQTLAEIGGLRSIANHLADDYQLGAAIRGLGKQIVLSSYVTTSEQYDPSLPDLIRHETRWMRTIRVLRPGSFPFLFVTFTLPLALIGFALTLTQASFHQAGMALLALCITARAILHGLARVAGDGDRQSRFWLVPFRDLLVFWVWCRALRTSRVTWRGAEFEVDVHGVMRSGQI
jgi:ceramide glucosyltransferase